MQVADRADEGLSVVCLPFYLSFLPIQQNEAIGITVTIYSTLELSERVIVLGQKPSESER